MRLPHIIAAVLVLSTIPILSGAPALAEASAGPPCEFVELPTVAGGDNVLLAADRSGRYQVGSAGWWETPDTRRRA